MSATEEIHRLKSDNISYCAQLSACRNDATRLHNTLQTVRTQLLNELHSLRKAMTYGSESLVTLKTKVQIDTDALRDLESRLEELTKRMSSQSAAQVTPYCFEICTIILGCSG